MTEVPTLHIRNVPAEVYEGLKERAERAGRSLNAEVIDVLKETVSRDKRYGFMDELDALRREYLAPDDFPKPEEIIREARDERAREIERRTGDL
jgi:plasmid stability protein